jgi:hypothetical protein
MSSGYSYFRQDGTGWAVENIIDWEEVQDGGLAIS